MSVYWRGRFWTMAGGAEGDPPPAATTAPAVTVPAFERSERPALERSEGTPAHSGDRLADLEAANTAARSQLDVTSRQRDDAQARADKAAADLATTTDRATGAEQRELQAHQRALVAEHKGTVVPELIDGHSIDELDASVDKAKAAFTAAGEAAKQSADANRVPAGGQGRQPVNVDDLSPTAKIAEGLKRANG